MDGNDNRTVVLLKSKATKNRFYALVPPELGWRNAEEIDDFPEDMTLGIAYPCLEDGLNDFAIIRTTFETLEAFSDDPDLQAEMMAMIQTARESLVLRLRELHERIAKRQAFFLGTDMEEFKRYSIRLCKDGTDRRTLDNMMKVNVFQSVSTADSTQDSYIYHWELLPVHAMNFTGDLEARAFVAMLIEDVLLSVQNDGNYWDKLCFDRDVFQKFIALMFVNYATTDPMFYGTNKEDYGVAAEKDMSNTPLYRAVGIALRKLEREEPPILSTADAETVNNWTAEDMGHIGPTPANEHLIVGPLMQIGDVLRLLALSDTQRAKDCRKMLTGALRNMVIQLQNIGVVSPLALQQLEVLLKEFGVDGA